ncbi:hypothetical protein, partial [Eikenella corrodens]|uniref:hypothetical protein n=1 Tax=Eikenella corrodens TaxID=539 RepID=UPI00195669F2
EQFDQFVLNGLAEATFSHRNILITFKYSWLSRTAPNTIMPWHQSSPYPVNKFNPLPAKPSFIPPQTRIMRHFY